MTELMTILTAMPTKTTQEVRIAWKIDNWSGTGLWHQLHLTENTLQGTVESLNTRFGAGTHWIEERIA